MPPDDRVSTCVPLFLDRVLEKRRKDVVFDGRNHDDWPLKALGGVDRRDDNFLSQPSA